MSEMKQKYMRLEIELVNEINHLHVDLKADLPGYSMNQLINDLLRVGLRDWSNTDVQYGTRDEVAS